MPAEKALSFVTLMVIIAVSVFFLRIALGQMIKINIAQNEAEAMRTLKLISAALENYAKDYLGVYPKNITLLLETQPPYLDKNYVRESSLKGYRFSCPILEESGYSCSAQPVECGLTGRTTYTIATGGSLVSEGCRQK